MTLRTFTMEGSSDGTTITAALLGTGSPTNPTVDSGGSAQFENTTPYQGGLCARISYPAAASTGVFIYCDPVAAATSLAGTFAFRVVSDLAGNTSATIAQIRTSSSPIFTLRIVWVSGVATLHFFVGATDIGQVGTGSLTEGGTAWYRCSYEVNTSTGAYTVRLRDASDTLIGSALTGTSGSLTGSLEKGRFGVIGTVASNLVIDLDWIGFDNGGTSELAAPTNAAPSVDAGATQNVSASATVNLSASASDVDGTIASYAWTFDYPTSGAPSLTGGSTATPSFTAGSAGALYILRCTVTDNGGATAYDTVEVRVPVAGGTTMRPLAGNGTGTGTWTIGGGSATDGAALADDSDSTYVESPTVSGSEVTRRVRLQPSLAKATADLKEKLWTDTGTAHGTIRLYEGATLRQTWDIDSDTSPAQAIDSTPTTYTASLSGATISAITDWGNLYTEVGVTN